ncbi:MAG: SAM-dependent methyltransferase [Rhodospirillaceae bacterium]|nr:SAM-dependent methyltransferase [Rhodospirillaceae bacterium]
MTSSMRSPSLELLAYLRQNSLRESDIQRRLREETDTLDHAGWEVAPEQAQFLGLIVQLMGAKRILELGTFTGHSALAMAMALPDDGELVTCDMVEDYTDIAEHYWREATVDHKITLRLGPAPETVKALLDEGKAEKFDLVFIDANKKDYDTYYEHALQLVRQGGLIAMDNMFWDGRVLDQDDNEKSTVALRALIKKLHDDERITLSILPLDDGLALAIKR